MNITIQERAPLRYALESAILLYRGGSDIVATRHAVVAAKAGMRLGAGTPITGAFVLKLLELVDRTPLTYVPANVIAISRTAIAWYEPASVQPMFFQTSDTSAAAFHGKMLPQPPLVFIARKNGLSVYALDRDERPTLASTLCKAPYWNVFDDDRVCVGSMEIPQTLDPQHTVQWSKAFFGSNFTHLSGRKRWRRGGTYSELLGAALARGHFDPRWLEPSTVTLERVLCGK